MAKEFAAVLNRNGFDGDLLAQIFTAELASMAWVSEAEAAVFLNSLECRSISGYAVVMAMDTPNCQWRVKFNIRRQLWKKLKRKATAKQQELGAPVDTPYLVAAVMLSQTYSFN